MPLLPASTSPRRTAALLLLLALGLAASACGQSDSCPEQTRLECCQGGCNGDIPADPVCEGSTWSCPDGAVSRQQCESAGQRYCLGASVAPTRVGATPPRSR